MKKEISLAVFPFENLEDGSSDKFCKLLYVDLVTELSRFRHFRIFSDLSDSQELQDGTIPSADYAIKVSFRSVAETMRINARLVKGNSNHIVWADYFEGTKASVSQLQQNLLEKIAASLQQQVNHDLLSHVHQSEREDVSAYEFWLKGMEELKKGSLQTDEKAREYFTKAMTINPGYSLAYSGMSLSYFNEWSCLMWDKWDLSRNGAYEWAKKAIELDEQNYIAAIVLGRVYLYDGNYDLSEHYLRRALKLNPNDVFCLIQVASCFVYHGYIGEAEELYQRVLSLNPISADQYRHIGAFIALEHGEFEKSVSLGSCLPSPWLDFEVFIAASYYHAGQHDQMKQYWEKFLHKFAAQIKHHKPYDIHDVVSWLRMVNPSRGKSNFQTFLDRIGGEDLTDETSAETGKTHHENYFQRKTNFWEVSFHGKVSHFPEMKGLIDLTKLIGTPHKQIHCTELMGGRDSGEGELVFDDKAKRAYRKKLQELSEEITDCDESGDVKRKQALQHEFDNLLAHVTASVGLRGRTRKANDPVEKVRSAVTWRIRKAIEKIQSEHPALGKHLSRSVKTGVFCVYTPENEQSWEIFG